MSTRREFLGSMSWPAAAAVAASTVRSAAFARALAATAGRLPEGSDEDLLWTWVQQAFPVDRSVINLNNGGVCPSPATVMEATKRRLDEANLLPAYYLWQVQEPAKESNRAGLASMFGCDAEEIAITRNASESLQIVQNGFDLAKGDEIVCTDQDYPRMIATWKQRERRDGIVLKQVRIPVPCEDPAKIVAAYESAITPRTRLMLVCHVINLTGQVLPVRDVVALGRKRGIPVIVDGAHAFGQVAATREQLDCDYYGVSLHKWLYAPIGSGFLYVKRDKIKGIWPLTAAGPELDADIRKFEEIGTHPAANHLGVGEALVFHHAMGTERKEARLRYLRDYWAKALAGVDRIRLNTSLDPRFSCAIGNVRIDGVDTAALNTYLWSKHRIFTVAIDHPDVKGLRITPNVYTTLDELDRFVSVMETVARKGLPVA
jgi:selenocysteine lyase/cysteine desulfurase